MIHILSLEREVQDFDSWTCMLLLRPKEKVLQWRHQDSSSI